jgi:hypothetical protein
VIISRQAEDPVEASRMFVLLPPGQPVRDYQHSAVTQLAGVHTIQDLRRIFQRELDDGLRQTLQGGHAIRAGCQFPAAFLGACMSEGRSVSLEFVG